MSRLNSIRKKVREIIREYLKDHPDEIHLYPSDMEFIDSKPLDIKEVARLHGIFGAKLNPRQMPEVARCVKIEGCRIQVKSNRFMVEGVQQEVYCN